MCVSVCALAFSTFFAPIAMLPSLCSSAFYSTEISEKTSEIHKKLHKKFHQIQQEIYMCACVCVCALAFFCFFCSLFCFFFCSMKVFFVFLLIAGAHLRSADADRRSQSSLLRIDEPNIEVLSTVGVDATCVQTCVSV